MSNKLTLNLRQAGNNTIQ